MATKSLLVLLALWLCSPLPAQFTYDIVSYHGVTHLSHQFSTNNLAPQGYRLISLAVAGGLSSANYSAVWLREAGPAWVTSHGMSESQYTSQRITWLLSGYRPKLVTASGSGTNKVFAAVYVQDGVAATHQLNMSLAAFEIDAQNQRAAGNRLVCCATYGTSLTPQFAPIYEPVDDVAWGWEANDNGTEFADNIAAHSEGENRPAFFAMTDTPRYFSIWHDDRVGAWAWVGNRTSAQFTADKAAMANQGLVPLCIAAGGAGSNARFSGIFVERLTPYDRTLTHSGPASVPLNSFDTMMDSFVVQNRIRSASLAVTRNGRLVYARGYNYAEPGYPQTTATSLFRIGSISKPLCGMVAHDLIEHGVGGMTLNDIMVNRLGLTSYQTGVDQITLRQLLTHTSGFINVVDELAAAQWLPGPLVVMPPNESTIVAYAAQFNLTTPGQWKYSNAGNTAIGQMIEQATGQDYMVALQNRLLTPLGITRFGRQQGPRSQLLPNEVHYHLKDLYLRSGNLHADLRLMAPQYSQRFWDSAGGVVTSAVDLARVVAGSFQIGADSPVFSVARQNAMLNRQSFQKYGSSPGTMEQWTDGSWGWQEHAPGHYTYWHDGAQDGFRSFCLFRDDGVGVVVLFNGDHRPYLPTLQNAVDSVSSWPTGDQFPNYGLPTFPRTASLGSYFPSTMPNLGTQPMTFLGSHLDQVTSVTFDNTTLLPGTPTNWTSGYIELLSATSLRIHPPQGIQPGFHSVSAVTAAGSSNIVSVPFQFTPNFLVASQDYVIGGNMPFSVFASRGPMTNLSFVALAFSESTLPSVAPGVVSLGVGNQFSNLFTTDLRPFDSLSGLARWDFNGLAGWSHVDLQAVAIDFGGPTQFPLLTSPVFTVDRQ